MGVFAQSTELKIAVPPQGIFYHGIYPGGISGEEDDITSADLKSYEKIVGMRAAWVYFSHNWYAGAAFPLKTATWIRNAGATPYIRLMLRSKNHKPDHADRIYSLQNILDGKFDADLAAWGKAAKAFGTPLIVEYGTEMNGDWFCWNGKFNGGGNSGPQRFIRAYRHIIETIRGAGANNITWVFHINAEGSPEAKWNDFEHYYPGDDIVDWIAVSCYGVLTPMDEKEETRSFREKFDPIYNRIEKLAPGKPLIIAEYGCAAGYPHLDPVKWAKAAIEDILSGRWPAVRGFSWWNERWENDNNPQHNTTMRVQDISGLGPMFRETFTNHRDQIRERLPLSP